VGLLGCKNQECKVFTKKGVECRRIFNRDKNLCKNMLEIVKELKRSGKRPAIYCREIKENKIEKNKNNSKDEKPRKVIKKI
jgi:hypothetical protein